MLHWLTTEHRGGLNTWTWFIDSDLWREGGLDSVLAVLETLVEDGERCMTLFHLFVYCYLIQTENIATEVSGGCAMIPPTSRRHSGYNKNYSNCVNLSRAEVRLNNEKSHNSAFLKTINTQQYSRTNHYVAQNSSNKPCI